MRSPIQLLRRLQTWGHAVVEHLRSELDEVHVYHVHMLKRGTELVSKLSRDGLNSAWSMAKAIVDSTVTCPPRAQTAPVSSSRRKAIELYLSHNGPGSHRSWLHPSPQSRCQQSSSRQLPGLSTRPSMIWAVSAVQMPTVMRAPAVQQSRSKIKHAKACINPLHGTFGNVHERNKTSQNKQTMPKDSLY